MTFIAHMYTGYTHNTLVYEVVLTFVYCDAN